RPAILVGWCLAFAFALRETDAFVMLRAGQSALASRLYANVVFAREDELAALALVFALVCATPLLVLSATHGLRGSRA
ncbi:MAG: hypothetical protein JNL98_37385, partial [Bryobacterales bacterium]|nr:hypothetical protein [Bryobacterales bacterium]